MNTCVDCGKQIFKGHGQKRCEECKLLYRNKQKATWYKKANAPKHGLYQYAKFLKTLTKEELQVMYYKYMRDIKYIKKFTNEWQTMKSQLKAITTEYSSRDDELERIEAYETDTERDEILQNGVNEYEDY